ncbi:Uncharacterised protein [uncultured archaeon]|nr:Uncharacterised protein [uncultured archaeon]
MATETNFGDDSSLGPRFERFKFGEDEQNKKKRIVFIDKTLLRDRVHYKDGYGYMRCLQPDHCPACAAGMSSSDRYGTKVLEYYTDLDGNVSKPFGYTVKAFVFGNGKGNGTFCVLNGIFKQLGEKMYVRDFIVSCSNPKFQQMTFLPLESCFLAEMKQARPNDFAEVKADYVKKMSDMDILKVVAPVVTVEIMQKVVDGEIVRRSTKNPQQAAAGAAAQPAPATGQTSFGSGAPTAAPAVATAAAAPKDDTQRKMMDDLSADL